MNEASADAAPVVLDRLRADYLRCLLEPNSRGARELIIGALAAQVPAANIYLQVISPAMHEVGRLWETAQVSVAREHLATQITRAVMAELALHVQAADTVSPRRVAIVSTSPGEMHSLGSQIVSDFLEAQGWDVLNLGADTPIEEVVELTRESKADLVAISTKLSGHLLAMNRMCQRLRQLPHPPYIVAGGRAYGGDSAHALAVGADRFCDDPTALLSLLGQRFGLHAAD